MFIILLLTVDKQALSLSSHVFASFSLMCSYHLPLNCYYFTFVVATAAERGCIAQLSLSCDVSMSVTFVCCVETAKNTATVAMECE